MEKIQQTRILIVEDEASVAAYVQDVLKGLGYAVAAVVASGESAVSKVGEARPDLVLMDILLEGDLDGVGAAEQIRKQFHVPVVYLSAYSDEATLHRCKLTEPYGFVVKPFEESQLHSTIELALHKHRIETDFGKEHWSVKTLKSIVDAVMTTDEKGSVTFMNASAEELTGWKTDDASGKPWSEVFNVAKETSRSLGDSSVAVGLRDYALLASREGKKVPVDYTAAMLRDDKGKSAGFVFVFRDVSGRTKLENALAESRKRYKDLVNSIDGIIWEADRHHQFTFVSKEAQRLLGYPIERWLNEPTFWKEHLHPDDREWAVGFAEKAAADKTDCEIEYRMIAVDGHTVWVRDVSSVVVESNQPVKLRGVIIDMTERKGMEIALRQAHDELDKRVHERTAELSKAIATLKNEIAERKHAEEALRESEERYALAAMGANDGLWDWNLKTGEIYFSARWKSMLGYLDNEIGKSPDEWLRRVHPDDAEQIKAEIAAHLGGLSLQFQNEHRMRHKDGSYRWMLVRGLAVRDAWGAYRVAGSQTDITERKRAEEQLLHDAFHDALTNLSNRALFMDRLSGAAARSASRAKRGGQYLFVVLFLDLDRFKIVNDSLGHLIGDQLLIGIARRLETCLRPGDTIARLGGDEFAILIEDISGIADAIVVAERVLKELQLPFNLNGNEVFTSASIGIALSSAGYEKGEDLLRDADTAMYHAKARGKTRYEIFDASMHGTAVALLQLETDLRRAVERKEFLIYYQPIVSLQTRKIIGFEALVRWQHPDRGLLEPHELIPVAEETGLIIPIDQWVLGEACRQMHQWQTECSGAPSLMVSVNLSGKQFSQPDLTEQIARVLSETGLAAQNLRLEITESVIMENAEYATSMLVQLRDLDVRLLIDDFGTGYSSLSYLHRFPINTLKIDRSFVSRIGVEGENWEIVRTILTLANNLGMDVIAEGVETEEQLRQLVELGCPYGQGYLFSRPMDSESATVLIATL